ncbi:hypothetical protein HCG49_01660 [Arenibacter sp. 6A1]|uniref:hypothetical protein n=1 Tax=Arenibacter sp. 6A1 TaxID=2720391 RepID=UPI00144893EB|nr:hypothetical protein [Arenibacter sp. 6A1]NKI25266.1 hypothetical protein [Arenibacter sp. 6A1]
MKTIKNIFTVLLVLVMVGCENIEIEDVSTFDRTEILSFKAYGKDKGSILIGKPIINPESGTIVASVKKESDLSEIFATCTLTSGSTISPALDGYRNWSTGSHTFTVTSASGKRTKTWTINLEK